MALPLSNNTTYLARNLPSVKAADLNQLQQFLAAIYTGLTTIGGLVVDGAGSAVLTARAATQALLRFQASDGTARGLTDYLGFRTGPVLETYDAFYGCTQTSGVASAVATNTPGGFQINAANASRVLRRGTLQGTDLTGTWPTGALLLEVTAARVNTDYVSMISPFFYSATDTGSTAYIVNKCVTVVEFAFCFHNTLTSIDHFIGFVSSSAASTNPVTAATLLRAGLRYAPSAKADGTIKLVTNAGAGAADGVFDTGITPVANTIYRCRLEIHRSGTPLGAQVRLFVNGALTTATGATLPIVNPLGADGAFQFYSGSTATLATRGGLEIGYYKPLIMPLGSLTAGATSSDV